MLFMAPGVLDVLLAIVVSAAAATSIESQPLAFFSAGELEFTQNVDEEYPAEVCLRNFERPAFFARPFMSVRLLLEFDSRSTEAQNSAPSFKFLEHLKAPSSQLRIKVQRHPRTFCRLLRLLGPAGTTFCEDCSRRCPVAPKPVAFGSRDVAVPVPHFGGCVYVEQLPGPVRASWNQQIDPTVFVLMFVGLFLVWGHVALRESVALHAGIGGVGALLVIAMFVLIWMVRGVHGQMQRSVGRTVTAFGTMLFAMVPGVRDAFVSRTFDWIPAPDWKFWTSLTLYGVPVGWLVPLATIVLLISLVLTGANISVRYFSAQPEPTGSIDFIVGSDGRRIDQLPPPPWPQRLLGCLFWLTGVTLLLTCTYSDVCSLLITILAVLKDIIWLSIYSRFVGMSEDLRPEDLRPLISESQYRQQASEHTRRQLESLRSYLQANPHELGNMGPESELRLRRFAAGMNDKPQSCQDDSRAGSSSSLFW